MKYILAETQEAALEVISVLMTHPLIGRSKKIKVPQPCTSPCLVAYEIINKVLSIDTIPLTGRQKLSDLVEAQEIYCSAEYQNLFKKVVLTGKPEHRFYLELEAQISELMS